ncbi:MAG: hypothetical protein ABIQ86_11970 [Steroidobacteraceae bacterium]
MAVPWVQIIQWAPQILALSRDLLNRSKHAKSSESLARAAEPDQLSARVGALEENERRQAELVDRMAAQQAELTKAVVTLHRRQRLLIGAVVVLALALFYVGFSS